MLSQNFARSLSALCALFVAERAQSLSSVFPRFSLAAAFAVGCSLLKLCCRLRSRSMAYLAKRKG